MSLSIVEGKHTHYPAKGSVFEFDDEVAKIFESMARRSIPMYQEAHRLHVSLLAETLCQPELLIYDIGSSRGQFFKECYKQMFRSPETPHPDVDFVAIDLSRPMLNELEKELPHVQTIQADARVLPTAIRQADVICLFYVLQFIKEDEGKQAVLRWAYDSLKPGGYLLLGQKETLDAAYDAAFAEEYYAFRVANGYSMDEIRAKSAALKNSMWPIPASSLESFCTSIGFNHYVETSRWLQFSTSLCRKPEAYHGRH